MKQLAVRVSVAELVNILSDTYSAIDLRSAQIRDGDAWVSVLTVIRLTYEEPPVVEERLRQLERLHHGPIETSHFRVVMSSRPFPEWKDLCAEISRGVLRIGNTEVGLRLKRLLGAEKGEIRPDSSQIRPFDGWQWPALQVCIGAHDVSTLGDETITREVGALGYSDALEAINASCEVNVWQGQSHGFDLYVFLPALIHLADVKITSGGKSLEVLLKRHRSLVDLKAIVFVRERTYRLGQPSRVRVPIETFASLERDGPIEKVSASINLPGVAHDDWVEVKLVHPILGEIGQSSYEARMLIPSAERNILFHALRSLCPDAELRQLLLRPYERKPQKLDQSASFELRVAWILGLFGLSAILLGEYENLVAAETKVHRGSVDILAANQKGNILFLVACTLGVPKEEDFSNLSNMRAIFEKEVFADTRVRIVPIVFTAARGCPSYKELEGILNYLPIVDADKLETVIELLHGGREERFFEFLANPMLNQLRRP